MKHVVVRNKGLETMARHKVEMMEGAVVGDFEKYSRQTAELEESVTRNLASRSAVAQKPSVQSGFGAYLERQLAGKDANFEVKASRNC